MKETPNLTYIKDLSGGDQVFETKIIEIIKREFAKERTAFSEAFGDKDHKKAASLVHKIKHKIGLVGLKKGYKISEDFEEDLKKGDEKLFTSFTGILDTMEYFIRDL